MRNELIEMHQMVVNALDNATRTQSEQTKRYLILMLPKLVYLVVSFPVMWGLGWGISLWLIVAIVMILGIAGDTYIYNAKPVVVITVNLIDNETEENFRHG